MADSRSNNNLSQEQFFDAQQSDRALNDLKSFAGLEHWNDSAQVRDDMHKFVREPHKVKKPRHHTHGRRGVHKPPKNGDNKR